MGFGLGPGYLNCGCFEKDGLGINSVFKIKNTLPDSLDVRVNDRYRFAQIVFDFGVQVCGQSVPSHLVILEVTQEGYCFVPYIVYQCPPFVTDFAKKNNFKKIWILATKSNPAYTNR